MKKTILLIKSSGNQNHDPDTGEFCAKTSLPVKSSDGVADIDEARSWWAANLGGKVADLAVHVSSGQIKIKVEFPRNETHAFTRKADAGEAPDCYDDEKGRRRPRKFVAERAARMDSIVRTIEHPKTKAVHHGADLLFERQINSLQFVVALNWSEARKLYVFDSAYSMPTVKVRDIIAHQDRRKNSGPLQKSEPLGSAHSVFRDSTESGIYPTGSKPVTGESIGFCRCCNDSLVDLLLLGKSYVDLDKDGVSTPLEFPLLGIGNRIDRTYQRPSLAEGKHPEVAGVDRVDSVTVLKSHIDTYTKRSRISAGGITLDLHGMRSGSEALPASVQTLSKTLPDSFGRIAVGDFSSATTDIAKSITLIFPNGNRHIVADGDWAVDETLAKSDLASGQRWITVHPNGKGSKGVPVMVQEDKHGSGAYHVIGGAGGKLNYLKLHGIKPQSSYKEHAAERAKAKAEQKKQQRARDKELGIEKGKGKAREAVKSQKHEAQKTFIKQVAEKMGWKDEDLAPKIPEVVSQVTRNKLEAKHHNELLGKAHQAVELQRQNLLTDVAVRQEAGIAPEPSEHDDSTLSTSDLDDTRPQAKTGLGFSAHYAERAEAQGATPEAIQKEADEKKAARQVMLTDGQRSAIKQRGMVQAQIKEEIKAIREPIAADVKAVLADAKSALELLKAQKQLKAVEKSASAAMKDIDESREVKAYNLEVSAPDDGTIEEGIENDLRTIRTKAFLSAIDNEFDDPEKQIRQHVGAGAYNSINALAITKGGTALVDRSVVDVLGMSGAAQVLARRLHADLSVDEMEKLAGEMEDYHLHHYMETSQDALKEAQSLRDAAKEIQLGEATHGDDFEAAREIASRRKACVERAHQILGTALGEMEANAALVTALKAGRNDAQLEVPLGKIADEDAIRQARAIGLQRGDYSITRIAGNQVLTVTPQGMDRLAKPVDRAELERTRTTMAILKGEHDEDDWLPQGFSNRPDLALDLKPGVAATLAQPFDPSSGDLEQSLRDYIGGRTADGDAPADIVADIQSSDFFDKAGNTDAYRAALDAVAPIMGKDGKMARAESLAESFNHYADAFVGGKASTLQRQNFTPDAVAQDALHRALADEPAGVAAYKPIGELSHDDQATLRKYFYASVAHESQEAAGLRERLESMGAHEPEKESVDMFGDTTINPEWHDWKAQRDTLAEEVNSASLDWQKYTGAMNGHENAYAAIQDMIRSRVGKAFHQHYNTLNPSAPLKLGRQVIRNNLNHLDAVDPQARADREAQERELIDGLRERDRGRYASGGVADKLDAARERKEAFEQSQMGFFSTEQESDMFGDAPKVDKPLKADERRTLGHAAERTIAGMMGVVGQNFKPGQPLKIFNPTMSGPEGILRQRAIKFIAANKRMSLSAGVGSGKAQPLDALILTPSGWVRMGDIAVGDKVIAGDGSVASVVGVYPQGEKDIYRVTMSDGGSTECCDEHLWMTTTENERKRLARGKPGGSVKSLHEIRHSMLVRHGIRNHHIPVACAPAFEAKDVPIAPYLMGALLGDGSISDGGHIKISLGDPEIAGYVSAALPSGCVIRKHPNSSCDYQITKGSKDGGGWEKTPLSMAVISVGLHGLSASQKFIPQQYLFNTESVRLGVLRGLMDTDGCAEANGVRVTFSTTSPQLVEGVVFLCRSLGGGARVTSKIPKFTYKGEKKTGQRAYCVTLNLPPHINPFRLPRKADQVKPKTKYAPKDRVIKDVSFAGVKQAQCIAIDHPLHLYVTDDFIVTHNTAMMLGAYSHLQSQGQAKKGIIVCPSTVIGGVGADALRFMEPGKFKWHCDPGASFEDRLSAYKDPETHFSVVTHQSFRDDLLKMASMKTGEESGAIAEKLNAMSRKDRAAYTKDVMAHHGISFDFTAIDEGHNLLDRAGKENSMMSNVIGGVTDNANYMISSTADVVKNDLSELHSALEKIDSERYGDRDAFMRQYGVNTAGAKEALRREMVNRVLPFKIEPKVRADKREISVKPSEAQSAALADLDKNIGKARMARMEGKVDVAAMKAISPGQFKDAPEEQHEAIAKELSQSLGIIKGSAVRAILDSHPESVKIDALAQIANERKGKPGVVFAHSLEAVENIKKRLEADGHRVITLTGGDSSADKAAKIRGFNPDKGDRTHDIMVASDAGSTGANLQSGQWLVQTDTPMTAMSYFQRAGRIHRIGQKNDVELLDLVADHPSEYKARERLKTKTALRELLTSPMDGLDDTGLAYWLHHRKVQATSDALL